MSGSSAPGTTTDRVERYKQKLGLFMCAFYALAYAGFVGISVFNVELMDTVMPGGINLAVFYGFGLIFLALILAMVFSLACDAYERKLLRSDGSSDVVRSTEPTAEEDLRP